MEKKADSREGCAKESTSLTEDCSGRGGEVGWRKIGHSLAVMSGKGGVGKSLVTSLLASSLAGKGFEVGILDADITGPSIPRMFGLKGRLKMFENKVLPAQTEDGIKVMSLNLILSREDEAVIWRGPLIGGAIKQFWDEVFWGEVDYLLVDLPPGTADAPLTVMQSIPLDGVIIVSSPQDLVLMVVRKAIRMAQKMNVPALGIVENMSHVVCPGCGERMDFFGDGLVRKMAEDSGIPYLGQIPLDPEIARLCDEGKINQYRRDFLEEMIGALLKSFGSQAS
ncbi:MAG: Mrp/NBP35 family ATP-binding protein [Actinomycetota bacterium]|nr:Mrp/NBP35 family ATP-binding protein [Actinomycetota bacterium]